jgi:hypothetical protein
MRSRWVLVISLALSCVAPVSPGPVNAGQPRRDVANHADFPSHSSILGRLQMVLGSRLRNAADLGRRRGLAQERSPMLTMDCMERGLRREVLNTAVFPHGLPLQRSRERRTRFVGPVDRVLTGAKYEYHSIVRAEYHLNC